jgi:diguanylate cyclase (GGDEF)-like protein/PAS domain S-box-containing protein
VSVVHVARDINQLKKVETALKESEEKFHCAFSYSGIGMALVSPDGHWLNVNDALCDIVGYSREELLQKTFQDITHPGDLESDLAFVHQMLAHEIETYRMEKRYLHKAGHIVWIVLTASLVLNADGSPRFFISQIEDISVRKQMEEQLRYDASYDQLTGVFNRRAFMDCLEDAFAQAKRYGISLSLCICDIDHFKKINDTFGHPVGDTVLRGFSDILVKGVRQADMVGRIGGDEFAVILPHTEEGDAYLPIERIRAEFAKRTFSSERSGSVTSSATFGIASVTENMETAKDLIASADEALYIAKSRGRNAVVAYKGKPD